MFPSGLLFNKYSVKKRVSNKFNRIQIHIYLVEGIAVILSKYNLTTLLYV